MGDEKLPLGDFLLNLRNICGMLLLKGGDEMITTISNRISHFLLKNNVIAAEDIEIYQYGLEIIVSTILGTLIVFLIGVLLHMFLLSLLYYGIFVLLRQMTGGYHADTYFKCNLTFGLLSFAVLGLTRILSEGGLYSWNIHILLLLFSIPIIAKYAPVENPNKPLDDHQKKRNRNLSIVSSLILSAVSCVCINSHPAVSILFGLTLFLITMLLLVEKLYGKEEEI